MMVKSRPYLLFMLGVSVFVSIQCSKSVNYNRPRPGTVTPDSREFFGCIINGHPFNPQANEQVTNGICKYASVYSGNSGWLFQITGELQESPCRSFIVSITLDSVVLEKGKTYTLGSRGARKNYGSYAFITECSQSLVELFTTDDLKGEVTITKVDNVKKIVTGTFEFWVKDANDFIYRISDGIFDRHYSN